MSNQETKPKEEEKKPEPISTPQQASSLAEPKKEEPKKEAPKKEEPKKEEPKKEEPKKEEPKKVEPKKEKEGECSSCESEDEEDRKQKEEEKKKIKEAISSLPANVKPYFIALKSLSDENDRLDEEYQKELDALDKKYDQLKNPLHGKRKELVTGSREPTNEELKEKDNFVGEAKSQPQYNYKVEDFKDVKGVPDFWYKILSKHPHLKEDIKPNDHDLLKHLIDITHIIKSDKDYKLVFTFSPNEYLETNEITMEFKEDGEVEKEIKCSELKWKAGKDLSKKTIKKKQKHKKSGAQRTITKEVDSDSFFTFFKSLTAELEDANEEGDEMLDKLEDHLELGEIIADLIDDSLYYYFNIVNDDSNGEIEEGNEKDEDEEDDEKEHKKPKERKDSKGSRKSSKDDTKKQENAKDCKQQ